MASVIVDVDLDEFSDDEIREEYDARFKVGATRVDPQLEWSCDRGPLIMSFSAMDAGRMREAIETQDAYRVLDLIRMYYIRDGKVAA